MYIHSYMYATTHAHEHYNIPLIWMYSVQPNLNSSAVEQGLFLGGEDAERTLTPRANTQ